MDWNYKFSSCRKEKMWITTYSEAKDQFITGAIEINVLTGDVNINWLNVRDYILIEGEKELGKDNVIYTLGEKEDNIIKVGAINFAINEGHVKRVCKRLGIDYNISYKSL